MTIYKDQLEAVYKLIEKPENWTQEVSARDSNGRACNPGKRAKCWCLVGAYWQVIGELSTPNGTDLMSDALGVTDVATWNDTHTHAEVLELLQHAIDRAPVRGES